MKPKFYLFLLAFTLIPLWALGDENLTLTTYYPSPYGSYNQLSTAGNTYLATNSGNVGIGTTKPGAKLHLKQSSLANNSALRIEASSGDYRSIYMGGGGPNLCFYNGANEAYLNSSGVWTNASDIAYKKDIRPLVYGLDDLMKLQARSYRMKANNLPQIGFIAQEVEKIIPELVSGQEGKKGLADSQMNALIVKSVQEQQKEIESLKAEIRELKAKLSVRP